MIIDLTFFICVGVTFSLKNKIKDPSKDASIILLLIVIDKYRDVNWAAQISVINQSGDQPQCIRISDWVVTERSTAHCTLGPLDQGRRMKGSGDPPQSGA